MYHGTRVRTYVRTYVPGYVLDVHTVPWYHLEHVYVYVLGIRVRNGSKW
jgi:hypothetical protein